MKKLLLAFVGLLGASNAVFASEMYECQYNIGDIYNGTVRKRPRITFQKVEIGSDSFKAHGQYDKWFSSPKLPQPENAERSIDDGISVYTMSENRDVFTVLDKDKQQLHKWDYCKKEVPKPFGKWSISQRINPLDDQLVFTANLTSENKRNVGMTVSCTTARKAISVALIFLDEEVTDGNIVTRVDKEKAVRSAWNVRVMGTGSMAVPSSNINFSNAFINSQQLIVSYSEYMHGNDVVSFDMTSYDKVLSELRYKCEIN